MSLNSCSWFIEQLVLNMVFLSLEDMVSLCSEYVIFEMNQNFKQCPNL